MAEPSGLQRRRVWFSGRVQGVGFRFTTCRLVGPYPITGFVQNLPDGRVLLVAEGPPQVLEQFVAEVRDTLDRYIDSAEVEIDSATGEFAGFGIRR